MDQQFALQVLTLSLTLFTLITGVYLTHKAKPYNSTWSNLHRVATFILLFCYILMTYPFISGSENSSFMLILFYGTIILFVLSALSGFIVASLNSNICWLTWSHRIIALVCYALGAYIWFSLV